MTRKQITCRCQAVRWPHRAGSVDDCQHTDEPPRDALADLDGYLQDKAWDEMKGDERYA